MMKWSPWPPSAMKRFEVKVELQRLEGIGGVAERGKVVMVEMRWKGPKLGLVPLRRRERKNTSMERAVGEESWVDFGDSFENVCGFSTSTKGNVFNAWDVSFSVLYGDGQESRVSKPSVIGSVWVNLGEIASQAAVVVERGEKEARNIQRNLPIPLQIGDVASNASLLFSVSFVEIRTSPDLSVTVQEANVPEKEDSFLRRMTNYVSPSGRAKKKKNSPEHMEEPSDGQICSRLSVDSNDSSTSSTQDLLDDDQGPVQPEQLGYGPIASAANFALAEVEDDSGLGYSSSCRYEEARSVTRSESSPSLETAMGSPPKGRFLSWKKRRLSLRGGKRKEEPLLKKGNEEGGGDDIDFVRRQLCSSSDESTSFSKKSKDELAEKPVPNSEFGSDDFTVGNWEEKELISRDGQTMLKANMFFASIDQRSERAAGESACTALVVVIADWLQANQGAMPTRSEFDNLIREGSLEWRKLCQDRSYQELFPDKHFDLDTILEAGTRLVSVSREKSFIGFFCPENFEFLQGAMSFDDIWNEISSSASNSGPQVYIVSWNDHFFVLRADADAYYIIDTLGERLFEGCNQAYILKFDTGSSMYRVQEKVTGDGAPDGVSKLNEAKQMEAVMGGEQNGTGVVCSGRECCREFIKRFLAAIPLGQLEMDVKKGIVCDFPLHQRLQIEFHFSTPASAPSSLSSSTFSSPSHTTTSITQSPASIITN
ncbi:hypothetical protein MRB53_006437 [Persea americana]|uniref:Uncharacterized protein n=1 Tax=Persea americana TaxID=3435 RepID=A0ACC2MGD3_PERAE|nr:hypothetical protein MRB53_006437 [Persea americana]